jgi:N-acetylmuramoyl-L-alanine amidase
LRDAGFQQALAQALMAGIVDFFRDHAPTDTYVARNPPPVQRPPIQHVISRGETLSGIAERYRTSVPELRRTNRINGDVIRIGQVLTIPTQS